VPWVYPVNIIPSVLLSFVRLLVHSFIHLDTRPFIK